MSRTSEDSLSELAGKVEAKEGSNFNLSLSMVVLREESFPMYTVLGQKLQLHIATRQKIHPNTRKKSQWKEKKHEHT